MTTPDFQPLSKLIPPGVSGNVRVEHFEISKADSERSLTRSLFRPGEFVPPGKYVKLIVDGNVMMSDTLMERDTNRRVLYKATGNVLIAGLGLGMILHPIAAKPEVKTITVIEKSPDVIKLVAASLPKKVEVIEADIFTWKPAKGASFDTIYHDVWPNITLDNLPEMTKLHRRFGRYLTPDGWMDSWQRGVLLRRREQEKNNPWRGGWNR